jgi:hypothetical protein
MDERPLSFGQDFDYLGNCQCPGLCGCSNFGDTIAIALLGTRPPQ